MDFSTAYMIRALHPLSWERWVPEKIKLLAPIGEKFCFIFYDGWHIYKQNGELHYSDGGGEEKIETYGYDHLFASYTLDSPPQVA